MPVYVYRCERCDSVFEKRQSFSDAPLSECEHCHGVLHKVFSPAAIIFKGSGFYSTDYHGKSGGESRNGSSDNGSEKGNGSEKSDSQPAGESKEPVKTPAASEG